MESSTVEIQKLRRELSEKVESKANVDANLALDQATALFTTKTQVKKPLYSNN